MSSNDDPLVGFAQTTETTIAVSERLYNYLSEQFSPEDDLFWKADNGILLSADFDNHTWASEYSREQRLYMKREDWSGKRVVVETMPCFNDDERKRMICDYPLIKEALTQAANEARVAHKKRKTAKPSMFDELETV